MVTSAKELGTMSKNSLRGITLGIKSISGPRINSLNPRHLFLLIYSHRGSIDVISQRLYNIKNKPLDLRDQNYTWMGSNAHVCKMRLVDYPCSFDVICEVLVLSEIKKKKIGR